MSSKQFQQNPQSPAVFAPAVLQRKCACGQHSTGSGKCSACSKGEQSLQRSTPRSGLEPQNATDVPPVVHEVLRSSGVPLDAATRAFFEPRFGYDFSRVRAHTDDRAQKSAHAVSALAYTVGHDIVLGPGVSTMGALQQKRLLAHELAHVVQQRGAGQSLKPKLSISDPADTQEREADLAAERVLRGETFHVASNANQMVSRFPVQGSAASVSWIDPRSPAGARVPDPAPGPIITESFVTGNSGFRFTNYLQGEINTPDSVRIASERFQPNSGIYRAPSYLGIPSFVYPTRRSKARFNEGGIEGVDFVQLVGARTISPGVIGGGVGAGAGIVAGARWGWGMGTIPGFIVGPIGPIGGAVIGGVAGGVLGWGPGSTVSNSLTNLPPIWTRIRLRLFANGQSRGELLQHSHFPSNNFYRDLSQVSAYSALAPEQSSWENSGWDNGNPWGISRPLLTP